jgi:predicted amidohydrolase
VNFRLALAQTAVTGDKKANLDAIATCTAQAARRRARLAVFPEASMYHFGRENASLAPASEALDGPFVTALGALARQHGMWLLAGMFERIDGEERVYNTLVLLDDSGTLCGSYRKIHLFDAFGYEESRRIAPGDGATLTFEIEGLRFGAFTCYDLRFPELARRLALAGARVLLLPAAWYSGPGKEMQFETLLRARAIENTVYLGSADQCTEGFCANSVLYDPAGVVVASLGERPGLLVGDVSTERVSEVRAKNPSLANGRIDLYSRWVERDAQTLTTR